MIQCNRDCDSLLPLAQLREELVTIGEAIGLQEEAEQDSAVGRHGLVLIASRSPDELTRFALSLVILERAFDDISLLERGVLVQRHDGARIELEQGSSDAAVVRALGCRLITSQTGTRSIRFSARSRWNAGVSRMQSRM